MSGGFVGTTGGSSGAVETVTRTAEVVRELAKPTGAQINKTIAEVRSLVEGLSDRVDTLIQDQSYNKAQIDAKDSAVRDLANTKSPLGHGHDQSEVSGTWSKNVDQAGLVRTSELYSTSAPGYNITGTRVAAWLETATGRVGTASSSERFKTNIVAAEIDPLKVLSIEPVYYNWIADVQERERRAALPPTDPEYDPDMHLRTELGMIAERLHEAGLWQFVIYEQTATGQLTYSETGDVIPKAIHYAQWGVALQSVARYLAGRVSALEDTRLHQEVVLPPLSAFTVLQTSRDVEVKWPKPFADGDYLVTASVDLPANLGAVATARVVTGSKTKTGCTIRVRTTGIVIATGTTVTVEALHA